MESKCKSTEKRIAVVTGANKGIGLEIVRQLANNGIMVILTARDEKRGTEAVEKLINSGVSDVLFHQLDVSDSSSVVSLAHFIKTKFGKLDILINNAAIIGVTIHSDSYTAEEEEQEKSEEKEMIKLLKKISVSTETYQNAEECLNINYYGTKRMTEELIFLLRLSTQPKIVNVSSILGKLEHFSNNEKIVEKLSDTNGLTEEELDELLKSYLNDFKEGKLESNGWPISLSAYKVSKMFVNVYTRIIAKKFPTFYVNSVHPGFVRTDMSWGLGTLSSEEGAKGPVMLALLPEDGPSGCFFDGTKIIIYLGTLCTRQCSLSPDIGAWLCI
ncbi:(+)-neomenthol dehydrogenase-like [Dioscorea cayenensis subsp. rotundata]|uniref:(+)-neomenthol dehydrogenase-like n=1 Tax=Dioscorea cayennensis subsp. rotundata TaxID=55577 RepID=A0AB40C0V5_DIOCR|nr:(+)-neomenthol dehydrogenase-like [Dioscorea cayenensis subsp. rotundata]